ncbi:hypothetical protein BDF22DRAFT_687994 [Syncephalis plumigaleata]|nr:hypothetical protein BDF22DRAFT_687994 [Syncephalis plumigaleata]
MAQFNLSFILLIAISIHSIALPNGPSTTNAAPTRVELPAYGIINLPNGDKYMFAKITDAPNFGFNQWGALANGNGSNGSSATSIPSIATPGQPSLGSTETTNSITNAAAKSVTNSAVSVGKQTIREKSGIVATSSASTAATAVTAVTAPVLVTKSVVENVINRCTEADAGAACFVPSKKGSDSTSSSSSLSSSTNSN